MVTNLLFFLSIQALAAPPGQGLDAVIASTKALAEEVTRDTTLPGVSIALIEDQDLVWSAGFGFADLEKRAASTASTAYRVGSISKLFTAIAVMQLVEAGKIDLDRPLESYLPDLGVVNPFLAEAGPVKPRHILSHASGLVRESPVGSYFDGSGATPAAAAASLRGVSLVHPPGKVTKYSNIGVSLMGLAIERASGQGYEDYERGRVLGPLGMGASAFTRTPEVAAKLAKGYMQRRDRGLEPAPLFELATVAAGNLYSTVEDLARLAKMLHAGGSLEGHKVLDAKTLEAMWTPQFPAAGGKFGIGFMVGERFGEKTVEHNGAVYGFSSSFVCIPRLKLTAIVLANEDVAFGPIARIVNRLLGGAVAVRKGSAPSPELDGPPASSDDVKLAEGVYRTDRHRIEIRSDGGRAVVVWNGHPVRLTRLGSDDFIFRDRLMDGNRLHVERGPDARAASVKVDGARYDPAPPAGAPTAPKEWQAFAGDYGPAYLPVRVSVREGRLVCECETFEYEPAPQPDGSFLFARGTLYEDEALRFHAGSLTLGAMRFERR